MSKVEAAAIIFGILFILIFGSDYFLIKRRYLKKITTDDKKKKKMKKNVKELTEISYLVNKFNLDREKLPLSKLVFFISLVNSLIISLVAVTILLIDTYLIFQLILSFILLIALIYALYELMGRFLIKKGYDKNEI